MSVLGIPPYVTGNKKFKTLDGLHRAILRAGARSVGAITRGVLNVEWDKDVFVDYPVEHFADRIVVHDLHYDLDGKMRPTGVGS